MVLKENAQEHQRKICKNSPKELWSQTLLNEEPWDKKKPFHKSKDYNKIFKLSDVEIPTKREIRRINMRRRPISHLIEVPWLRDKR